MSCCGDKSESKLIVQAKHFIKEVVDTANGTSYEVSQDIQQERLAHCKQCENLNRLISVMDSNADIGLMDRCLHPKCGCLLRLKTSRSAQSCPLSKWNKID